MSTYDRLAGLELEVDGYELRGRRRAVSSAFERQTTEVVLHGAGVSGTGEDVVYAGEAHDALQAAGPVHDLAGRWTVDGFSRRLGELALFAEPPPIPAQVPYRRWAFESAAVDLALRQAGRGLPEALGRPARPLTYVVSLRLGEPPSTAGLRSRLQRYPGLRFKLDPTSSWSDALIAELVALEAVDTVDFKNTYKGTVVDQDADPDLYARVAEAFPAAWIEDPDLTDPRCDAVLRPHRERVTWDAPIHGVADLEALPFAPRMVNVKPSRFGTWRELCATYDWLAERGIGAYGGGQFELGVGRGQVQLLASLMHPDAPNDVAPGAFNDPEPPAGLPESPLAPAPAEVGFAWAG